MTWDPLDALWRPGWEQQQASPPIVLPPRPEREYFVGLDLGQQSDPTAIAVAEQVHVPTGTPVPGREAPTETHYHVRHLERLALGTSYPAVVARVAELVTQAPLRGAVSLAVDGTGVGLPVVDMLKAVPLHDTPLYPVLITSGDHENLERGVYHVPKRTLVANLQVFLQSERLKIAAGLPEAATLTHEPLNFKIKLTAAANDVYGVWREGQHDDLVLATALAVWLGEQGRAHVWIL